MTTRTTKKRVEKTPGLKRMPAGLTATKIKKHVMNPLNTRNFNSLDVTTPPQLEMAEKPKPNVKGRPLHLDVEKFGSDLHAILKEGTAGYAIQIRQRGNPIYEKAHGFAQTSADDRLPWTVNTRMHLGSVSKLMTAMGMLNLLERDPFLNLDTKIKPHLPVYWDKGPNIGKITIRHLLKHQSGLGTLPEVGSGQSSSSNYPFMKLNVSLKTPLPGSAVYQNMNYGLMRILIPILNGDIRADFDDAPDQVKDQTWDALTIAFFKEYMQDHVFTPAGVAGAGFAPLPLAANSALAYAFPPTGFGWNSGDLQTLAGGVGWRLSVSEVLNVMDHFRRRNTILSIATAEDMINQAFGLNGFFDSDAGPGYFKKGAWGDGIGRTEQSYAFFLPREVELVLLINSQLFAQDFIQSVSVSEIIADLYRNNLKD